MAANSNPMALYIVGGVIGTAIVGTISYYVARAMKGSMKIVLKQKSARSGQTIDGELTVNTKKAISADRMYIALVGEQQVRRRSSGRSGTSTSWQEFYRDEADILLDERLPAGFSETYEFALDAPTIPQLHAHIEQLADGMDNDVMKSLVKGIGKLAQAGSSLNRGRKRWKVISRLETKGVDLAASRKVHVSVKSV